MHMQGSCCLGTTDNKVDYEIIGEKEDLELQPQCSYQRAEPAAVSRVLSQGNYTLPLV